VVKELLGVLHSFYIQILPINLIFSLNSEVWPKVKLLTPISLNLVYI